jgi:6-phosphogluconolactonase
MPVSTKRSIDRARVSHPQGAGGEPLGETPATPSEILSGVPDDLRGKLPDDVVDELLAGARTEEEIVGPGGLLSQLTKRLVERGNTPKGLYNLLASSPFAENIPWRKVFFFWSDERFVPHTHPDSNFRMAKENMLDKIPVPAKNIFSVKGIGDPALRATEYEHLVKTFFHSRKPAFDLIILGIGEDGHTASIFPGTEIILEKKKLIREVWVEEKKSWRISFTFPLINQAEAVLFLVSGKEKKLIMKKIFRKKRKVELPAELVNPHDGIMYWMMDEEAAQKKPFTITYSSYTAHPPHTKHG